LGSGFQISVFFVSGFEFPVQSYEQGCDVLSKSSGILGILNSKP